MRLGVALVAFVALLQPAAAPAGATAERADLAVDINPTSFARGLLDYLVSVDNDGPDPARGGALLARLPAGRLLDIRAVVLELPRPGCKRRARAVSCALGTLAAHSYEEVVISMRAPARGTYVLTARVSSPTPDPEPANNTGRARIEVP